MDRTRRYFSGSSLAQALMSAARFHGIEPEAVAYRVFEKRHGFVRHPRGVVIEVDPAAPRRAAGAPAAELPGVPTRPVPSDAARISSATATRSAEGGAGVSAERPRATSERRARPPQSATPEAWDAPDAESEVAAAEASRRLLQLAGLELEVVVRRQEDRLEVVLSGPDEERVVEGGIELLEELEHLLPRAVHGLSGRMVRCRMDCGGLRAEHDESLRRLARREAERVLATGEAVLLDPLSSAERRVVHLELLELPGVSTESLGTGPRKRIQISPATVR